MAVRLRHGDSAFLDIADICSEMEWFANSLKNGQAMNRCSIIGLVLLFTAGIWSCKNNPSAPENMAPRVQIKVKNQSNLLNAGQTLSLRAEVEDDDPLDSLAIDWKATAGEFTAPSAWSTDWQAPSVPGQYTIRARVVDPSGNTGSDSVIVNVGNRPPVILQLQPDSATVVLGNELRFWCTAIDSDGHALSYAWSVSAGTVLRTTGDTLFWKAPDAPGLVTITVQVRDRYQAQAQASVQAVVYREGGSVWVADTGNRQVVKISAEGREILRLGGFTTPSAVAVDALRRQIWIADLGGNAVYLFDLDGNRLAALKNLGRPAALALNPITGSLWVAESDSHCVREVANNGVTTLRRVLGLSSPLAITLHPKTRDLYVAATGDHRVVWISAAVPDTYRVAPGGGLHREFRGFSTPVDLAYDYRNGFLWVVDEIDGMVFWFADSSEARFSLSGLRHPRAVAVDPHRGTVWIADTGNGRVLRWQNGSLQNTMNGLLLPQDLAVDPVDGSLWVADTENDRLVKYAHDGTRLLEVYGFRSPRALAINPGQ